MPIGGESVGAAYVRILADGTGLDQSVADAFDDVDAERSGEKAGQDYGKGVKKGLRKSKTSDEVEELFRLDKQRIDKLTKQMEGTFFRNIELQVRKRAGDNKDLGDRIMRDIGQGFLQGQGDFTEQFGDNLERLFQRLPSIEKRALSDMGREWKRTLEEAYAMNRKFDEERVRSLNNRQRQEEMLAKAQIAANRENISRLEESVTRAVKAFERVSRGEKSSGERLRDSVSRTTEHVRELRLEIERVPDLGGKQKSTIAGTLDEMERGLSRVSPRFREFNGNLDRTAPRIGRVFGKGGRNDFLNFFGGLTEGLTKTAFLVPKLGEKISGLVGTFKAAGGGMEGLKALFAGGSGAFRGFASSLAAGAIAIPVVVGVLAVLASTMSLLLGVVTALASSITFGLIGAIGALGGSIVPVVAGIGVLGAAIASMSDEQKAALKQSIKPFVAGMKEIGSSAAEIVFGGDQFKRTIKGMTNALTSSNMKTLVDNIARAIGNVGEGWAKSLDSPGFKRFVDTMAATLPGQIEGLGRTTANVFSGMGGVIIALQPTVDRFVAWIERVTRDFANWANSMEGKTSIENFMDRAVESLKSVGHFAGQALGLIGDLLTAGQGTGDSLFDSMAKNIKKFRDYLAENPDVLKDWFNSAKNFGEALGDLIVGAGRLIDALDSPEFRSVATGIFETLATTFSVLGDVIGIARGAMELFIFPFRTLIGLITGGWKGAVNAFLESIATILDGIGSLGHLIGRIPGVPDGFGQSAKDAADKVRGLKFDTDKAKESAENLGKARPNPRASDGGTFDKLKNMANNASDAAKKLGDKKPSPRASEGGTFSKVKNLADAARVAIDKIPKSKSISIKGSIFPTDFLGALGSLGSKLRSVAGTYAASVRTNIPRTAVGGVFNKAQVREIAEDGAEAVVPLNRPLSQVDPAVRALSAFAQGMSVPGNQGSSRSVSVGDISVVTPTRDPVAVALETVNEIVQKLM